MQASLNDLSTRRDSPSFVICQRVLHKCHEIIFGDQVLPSASPYSGFVLPSYMRPQKVKHHAEPIFVGLGIMSAATPAMPGLAEIMGRVAIEQGRKDEDGENIRSLELDTDGVPFNASPRASQDEPDGNNSPVNINEDDSLQMQPPSTRLHLSQLPPSHPGSLISRRSAFGAQTLPALPLHLQTKYQPRLSEDPLGQIEDQEIIPYQSSPSIASARTPARTAAIQRADSLLEQFDIQSQMHLLQSHYYLSQVRATCIQPMGDLKTQKG